MRIPHRLLIAGTLLGLAGCASAPPTPQQEAATATETGASQATEPPPKEQDLPKVELNASLLYKLLVAEFAAQEGQLRLSADAYLQSAQETRDPRLARRATQAAVYARDTVAALTAANLWVELEPDNIDARQSLSALLIRSGQTDKAVPHMEKIIGFSPEGKRGHGYLLVANLLANSDDPEHALALMEQLTEPYRNDPDALYAHAKLANKLEHNETARTLLGELLQRQPESTEALILQARVLHTLGEEDEALASLERALKQNPDDDQMRLTYARMLVDAQQLEAARREFRVLNQHLPDNSDVIYALGLLALEAGDIDDAEPYFMDLVRLGERSEEARFALGQIAMVRKRPREAIDWFQSVPQGERYMEAQIQAAFLINHEEGSDEAIDYLEQLPLNDKEARIQRYQAIAELLMEADRHEEAMALYRDALTVFPDDPQLLYDRALAAEKMGRLDILEQDLKRIIANDPDSAQALNALGYTLADRTERHQEAYDYIKQAYALRPEDPAILDSMGWALFRLGRYEEALGYLRRAAEKLPRDAEIAAHLGEVLWVSGDKASARKVWETALETSPEHELLNATIKRLAP